MTYPKVSVIIPVYNTEAFVAETLHCILNQTLKEIEVIVVNDGSTDNSLAIVNAIAKTDDRVQVYSQKNQGQSVARNLGLKHVNSKYVYFIDSDDLLQHDALELCYERSEKNNLDILFFDGDIFYEGGQMELSWDYRRTQHFCESVIYNGRELLYKMLDLYAYRASSFLLFLKYSYLKKIDFSFYPGIIHEDELSTTYLFLEAKSVGCMKETFAHRRVRGNSTMTNKYTYRNVNCYFTVTAELLRYARTKDVQIQQVVDKYVAYTLNPVFQTAYSLPLSDRLKTIWVAVKCHYLKYLCGKSVLILLLKKLIKI